MAVTPTILQQGDLYQVDAPPMIRGRIAGRPFCAGMIVVDGVVRRTAPILSWARGRSIGEMQRICKQNGWHLVGPIGRNDGDERELI